MDGEAHGGVRQPYGRFVGVPEQQRHPTPDFFALSTQGRSVALGRIWPCESCGGRPRPNGEELEGDSVFF